MAVLWQKIKLSGSKGERVVNALFDSGATYSFVRKDIPDEINEEVIIGAKTMQSWRFKLDFENEKVLFDPNVTKLIII